MTITIALVGRPNVGKSTLFNRLVGRRLALVDDMPGLTRDRREGEGRLGHLGFRVLDTAGLEIAAAGSLAARMRAQTEIAIEEADLCLFLIDARAGVTGLDNELAEALRKSDRPVVVLANKCEGRAAEAGFFESYALGLGEPIAISAEHGEGLGELAQVIAPFVEAAEGRIDGDDDDGEDKPVRLVIVGRPNAGKSTLINRLVGAERLLTGAEAGITRDAIAIDWEWQGRKVRLFDTAGLRKRSRVGARPEHLARTDAMRAVKYAEVVVVLLDATQPLEKQDLQIAAKMEEEGRAVVLVLNKSDLVENRAEMLSHVDDILEKSLPQLRGLPVVHMSALTGEGLGRLMPAVFQVYERWNLRVPTGALNRWFAEIIAKHTPPAVGGRRIKLRYITQTNARPPTFVAFCSKPEALPTSYKRYIVNGLREAFKLPGVPIRLHLRKGKNPYADKRK